MDIQQDIFVGQQGLFQIRFENISKGTIGRMQLGLIGQVKVDYSVSLLVDSKPLQFVIQKIGKMSFLKRFFSCGCQETSDSPLSLLPNLCIPQKEKHTIVSRDSGSISSRRNLKEALDSSHPLSSQLSVKGQALPPTLRLKFNSFRTGKAHGLEWGFVVGVVNWGSIVSRLIKTACMQVRIGKKQEVTTLSSLRPRCLDTLVVYWSQLGCEFSLGQILSSQQRLLIIFQHWDVLSSVLSQLDYQLTSILKTTPLVKVSDKLSYNIIQIQTYFILQFFEKEAILQNLMKTIEKFVGFSIDRQKYNRIQEKITISDYFNLINHKNQEQNIIKRYLIEIDEEKSTFQEKQSCKDQHSAYSLSPEGKVIRNALSLGDKAKSNENQLQFQYFNKNRQGNRPSPLTVKKIVADLQIFNYNFQQQDESNVILEEESGRQSNLASPRFMSKKAISKSVDPEYATYDFFDDEIFEKYQ